MSSLQVLLVSSSPAFLQAATQWLQGNDRCGQVWAAQTLQEALAAVAVRLFEVVLVDVQLSDMHRIEETRQLKAGPFPPRVVLMTLDEVRPYHDALPRLGMDGVLDKTHFATGVAQFFAAMPKEASHGQCTLHRL
jgi:CheY-like chemotaxis protein